MKITVDREFTQIAKAADAKNAGKRFSCELTENDICRIACDYIESEYNFFPYNAEPLKISGSVFPSGSSFGSDSYTVRVEFLFNSSFDIYSGSIAFRSDNPDDPFTVSETCNPSAFGTVSFLRVYHSDKIYFKSSDR